MHQPFGKIFSSGTAHLVSLLLMLSFGQFLPSLYLGKQFSKFSHLQYGEVMK